MLFLLALALGAQNQQSVTFNYLLAQGEFHLSTLLGGAFILAFIFSGVIFGFVHFKSQLKIQKLNRALKKHKPAASNNNEKASNRAVPKLIKSNSESTVSAATNNN